MKLLLILLAALGPQALPPRAIRTEIPAPVFVSLHTEFTNKHADLTWTHPSAHWFVIRSITSTTTNFVSCKFNTKLDTFSLKVKFDGTTSFDIAATDLVMQSKWSNKISVQPAAEP